MVEVFLVLEIFLTQDSSTYESSMRSLLLTVNYREPLPSRELHTTDKNTSVEKHLGILSMFPTFS